MKAGKYTIKELFNNRYIQQIVIPEIQRDYVWEEEQVIGLLSSIRKDFIKYQENKNQIPRIDTMDRDLIDSFNQFYRHHFYTSNIGFIYAYNEEELPGKYFLIDGQQRLTTIYLLLTVLASFEDTLKEKFKSVYLNEDKLKLDYKVRDAAHSFMNDFIPFTLESGIDFTLQTNYHNFRYRNDNTIQSVLKNTATIRSFVKNEPELEIAELFDYCENYIEFWYFDTNISEQGEELYIYMNARGEHVEGNENLKAHFLGQFAMSDQKNTHGIMWEEWQDHFWRKRNHNENSDKGFNEFLACIAGLESHRRHLNINFYDAIKWEKHKSISLSDIRDSLTLNTIGAYVKGLTFLSDNLENFKLNYEYNSWATDAINEIYLILNETSTNWFANFKDDNRSIERRRMVYLWGVLYYLTSQELHSKDFRKHFRFLRMFYLRYKNNIRSVSALISTVDFILSDAIGVLDPTDNAVTFDLDEQSDYKEETDKNIRTYDEIKRNEILNVYSHDESQLMQIEQLLWKLEDHKFNIDGTDVGGTNLSHLLPAISNYNLESLSLLSDKFYKVFPKDQSKHLKIQNVLLHYGRYWSKISPGYYANYKFDDWRKIIRGYGDNRSDRNSSFIDFFTEFVNYHGELEEFIQLKQQVIRRVDAVDLRQQLLWYNQMIGDTMWDCGNYIAVHPDWGIDKYFPAKACILNTKGTLRSVDYIQPLSSFVDSNNVDLN